MALRTRAFLWGAFCSISVLANFPLLCKLWEFSIRNEYGSQIFLMPLVSAALIFRKRSEIAVQGGLSWVGIIPMAFGLALASPWGGMSSLSLRALGIVLLWIGGFISFFGMDSLWRFCLPLSFLVFMIPIPEQALHVVISLLQRGSAGVVAILFKYTGTAFYRTGLVFALPGINIEIAEECSSIRSSLALLISSMLAVHLVLRTGWRKVAFILVALPFAVIKNGIRIVVLSLLAVHVDRRWLTASDLHRKGGIVFFVLTLVLLLPILALLKRSENTHQITIE